MTVLKFREAAEETGTGKATMWRAIESDGAQNASLPQLPPEPITTSDLAEKLVDADAAISNLQQLLGEVRTSHNELRRALNDLKRDRDEWRERAERLTERPWWRRLAG
jgi:hypothetical protein